MKSIVFLAVCLSFFLLTNLYAGTFSKEVIRTRTVSTISVPVEVEVVAATRRLGWAWPWSKPVAPVAPNVCTPGNCCSVAPAAPACAPAACAPPTSCATVNESAAKARRAPLCHALKGVAKVAKKVLPPYRGR